MPDWNDLRPLREDSPGYLAFAGRLWQLHQLMSSGRGDSPEADALRDAMDGPWRALCEEERTRLRELSALLWHLAPAEPDAFDKAADELIATADALAGPATAESAPLEPLPKGWLTEALQEAEAERIAVIKGAVACAIDPEAVLLLRRAYRFVEADRQMMSDISRHAPLPPEQQAEHDSGDWPSARWLADYDAWLARTGLNEAAADPGPPKPKEHRTWILWGRAEELRTRELVAEYHFATEAELVAFMDGVSTAMDYEDYEQFDSEEAVEEYFTAAEFAPKRGEEPEE